MNGKQYFLIDVIAHILCHLKEKVLRETQDFGVFNSTVTDIDWVITVPSIWKVRERRMMREAGYMVMPSYSFACVLTLKDSTRIHVRN